MKTRESSSHRATLILVLSVLLVAASASAQNYRIDWYTIDGGGGTSSGGQYSLSGTIGQPDAGTLSGGPYVLNGGFWGGVFAVQQVGAPTLYIERFGSQVRISWDPNVTGFSLQEATHLAPGAWGASLTGSTNPAFIPASADNRFYQLKKP